MIFSPTELISRAGPALLDWVMMKIIKMMRNVETRHRDNIIVFTEFRSNYGEMKNM